MTHRFTVIFEKEAEGGYHVFCPTLPGCHSQSETIEEGVESIREAIELYVGTLIEDGLPVPAEDIFTKQMEFPALLQSSQRLPQRTSSAWKPLAALESRRNLNWFDEDVF